MKVPLFAFALAAFCVASTGASASSRIDTDGDGRYSLDELRVIYPTLSQSAYKRMDLNADGSVTPGEFRAGQDDGLLPKAVNG